MNCDNVPVQLLDGSSILYFEEVLEERMGNIRSIRPCKNNHNLHHFASRVRHLATKVSHFASRVGHFASYGKYFAPNFWAYLDGNLWYKQGRRERGRAPGQLLNTGLLSVWLEGKGRDS